MRLVFVGWFKLGFGFGFTGCWFDFIIVSVFGFSAFWVYVGGYFALFYLGWVLVFA